MLLSTINDSELRALLGSTVTKGTTRGWRRSGELPHQTTSTDISYERSDVNAFLARWTHGTSTPPTVANLASGTYVLIAADEAGTILGLSRKDVLYALVLGRLVGVNPPGRAALVIKASAEAYKVTLDSLLTIRQACNVLGRDDATIYKYARDGDLARTDELHFGRTVHKASLLALIARRKMLPAWVTPEQWMERRLTDGQPLFEFETVIRILGGTWAQIRELLSAHQVWFTYSGRREEYVDPVSLQEFLARRSRP